jgi:D-alanyl-D-alanine carboxypeptidase
MSFYSEVIQNSSNINSPNRVADLALLEPITRAAVLAIVAGAQQQGIVLMVYETFRSQQRQQALFQQQATKLQTVGVHHYGLACDLVKSVNGEPSWKGDFSFLKGLAEANGLIWGGDWGKAAAIHSFVDADHVQRINVADQSRLFNLSWYPDDAYRPQIG